MDATTQDQGASGCPFSGSKRGRANRDWWPDRLNLDVLHAHSSASDPMGAGFNYAEAFKTLDLDALVQDLRALMTDSQDWWPADFGHYGGLFIRLAWHSAGTYRVADGRGGAGGGQQRFAPLNSWPDNANLDKARRLLWPIKQKYGSKISWADLYVLVGNVALESMGFKTFGFGGGRADTWEPEELYWGPEGHWLGDERYSGERQLQAPLGAVQMGLIYVNPEGPNGNPDPVAAARDIRETFARMAMNDEETVALIAGGHTFGKTHGAGDPSLIGKEPEGGAIEDQGLGWKSKLQHRHRRGRHHRRSRSHVVADADALEQPLLRQPVRLRVGAHAQSRRCEAVEGEGRAGDDPRCIRPVEEARADDADDRPLAALRSGVRKDLAPFPCASRRVRGRFRTRVVQAHAPRHGSHRALPRPARAEGNARLAGPDSRGGSRAGRRPGHRCAEGKDTGVGIVRAELVATAWASASTFRASDKRGGANGARIRLAPQKDWDVNQPAQLSKVLAKLESVREAFNASATGGKKVSLADLIVLGGARGDRERRPRRRCRREGAVRARTHGRVAGTDGRAVVRAARAHVRRLSQLPATCRS